jgi:hypothetical protein
VVLAAVTLVSIAGRRRSWSTDEMVKQ